MTEDRLRNMFGQYAQADVAVPPAELVVARGRQRRRRARFGIAAAALALALTAALGARQLAHLDRAGPVPKPAVSPVLPPPGSGRLLLGLDTMDRFVMTRAGSNAAPTVVPGLTALVGQPSLLAANPGGGWVVTFTTDPGAPSGSQPARLALVSASGESQPFGPVFRLYSVTGLAVSPDGRRVAVALAGPTPAASGIEVLPMPGHRSTIRNWHPRGGDTGEFVSLSWAPDGSRLSYIAGFESGGGLAGAVRTLDTSAPGSVAPSVSAVSPALGRPCRPDAVAWLGTTGRLDALEECGNPVTGRGREILVPVNPGTGTAAGPVRTLASSLGCAEPWLASTRNGSAVLIGYCATFLIDHGRLSQVHGGLVAAAFTG